MNQTETKTVWTDAWPVFQIEWVQSAWRIRKTIDVDIDRWPAAMKQRLYSEYLTEIARIELSGIPPLRMAAKTFWNKCSAPERHSIRSHLSETLH